VTIEQLETDPHPVLHDLRSAGPVAWVDALGAWVITGRALAERVLKDATTFTVDDPRFSTARVVGPSMLSTDGAAHVHHRDPFVREFRPAHTYDRFGPLVEQKASDLAEAVRDAGHTEVRSAMAGPLAVFTMAEALGLGDTDAALVREWYDGIVAAVDDITALRDPSPRGAKAYTALRRHVEQAITGHEHSAVVVAAARRLSLDEVVSNTAVLLFGGIDTTEGMIANVARHLLLRPDQLAEVRADRSLLARAIEESVRLEPAAASVDRYATGDVELDGASIRQRDMVIVSLAAANRDPAVFTDPDVFDLRRAELGRHLSFAHGPHFCLGAHLARLETRAALDAILDRMPGLRLDPDHDHAPRGLIFRKPPQLHVRWEV
jgi:cytochrome P450